MAFTKIFSLMLVLLGFAHLAVASYYLECSQGAPADWCASTFGTTCTFDGHMTHLGSSAPDCNQGGNGKNGNCNCVYDVLPPPSNPDGPGQIISWRQTGDGSAEEAVVDARDVEELVVRATSASTTATVKSTSTSTSTVTPTSSVPPKKGGAHKGEVPVVVLGGLALVGLAVGL